MTAARPVCPEKARLLEAYYGCTDTYRNAVQRLKNGVSGRMAEYLELAREAEQARRDCETSRLTLEKHTKEHGC